MKDKFHEAADILINSKRWEKICKNNTNNVLVPHAAQTRFVSLNWLDAVSSDPKAIDKTAHGRSTKQTEILEHQLKNAGYRAITPRSDDFNDLFEQYLSNTQHEFTLPQGWVSNRRKLLKESPHKWKFWVSTVTETKSTPPTGRQKILESFNLYDAGQRPEGAGDARRYWIAHPETQALYPLKIIWALSTTRSNKDFTSNQKIREALARLGFSVVDAQAEIEDRHAFQEKIEAASRHIPDARRARLQKAESKPPKVLRQVIVYDRNPDVVAERLYLAQGVCEGCSSLAPFLRAKDNTPYLEVHHIVPLSEDGEDVVDNTIALCPNCHRRAHFG